MRASPALLAGRTVPITPGAAFVLSPIGRRAALCEKIGRLRRRLLSSVLKWVGLASVMLLCALLVYLAAVTAARLA